ncbi:DNA repair protein RecN (Recombination protein N) [Bacilli bacterium PM5-3]|nr:DNA repair protein RecN (Recombination protein N) [Bacilli bacterium PM5-3]MDH6603063.1 DNA repair protein RecN (Recombination protein N) [Bacilli bacterium PM5-9]
MLKQINIQNFAIINQMTIDFRDGLSVITGQTGAGKSIVIDAIEQLLGARASHAMVASNNDYALIEGIFDYDKTIENILNENDFIIDDDYLIINKKIKKDGKSQLKINNRIVTNDLVKQIGKHLVEIHSQDATYLLNEQSSQQNFIDSLFNIDEKKIYVEYLEELNNYRSLSDEYNTLVNKTIDPELLSFYQDQLKDIENSNLSAKEVDELTNQEAYYKDFEKISNQIESAISTLKSNNVIESLNVVNSEINKLSDVNENFTKLAQNIDNIYYNLIDFNEVLNDEYHSLSFDSDEYNIIKEKLFNYQKMIKKYGYSQEEVSKKITDLTEKIDFILNSDSLVLKIEQKIEKSKEKMLSYSKKLTEIRKKYINDIETKIMTHLKDLYLKDAIFKIDLVKTDFTKYGLDKVVFLFSANKGGTLRELSMVASGGELSRLMLALKIVSLNKSKKMYIFDEIDAGVSGEVANAIGLKIAQISKYNDVICITHLPQVAVYAKNHLYIEKSSNEQFTTSNCYYLSEDEKINEIAKMLSGNTVSETALDHAKELINNVSY